jgi:6-phosphogluconate dehydrogenase (decarboxylating)
MERIAEAGAGFWSLTEAIDTTTPTGRMMMQMVGQEKCAETARKLPNWVNKSYRLGLTGHNSQNCPLKPKW